MPNLGISRYGLDLPWTAPARQVPRCSARQRRSSPGEPSRHQFSMRSRVLPQCPARTAGSARADSPSRRAEVELAMFWPVHRLLADESGHALLQHRIGDLVGEPAYRPDERLLPGGKRRTNRDQMAEHDVVLDEVTLDGLRARRTGTTCAGLSGRRPRSGVDAGSAVMINSFRWPHSRWSTRTPSTPKSSSCHRSTMRWCRCRRDGIQAACTCEFGQQALEQGAGEQRVCLAASRRG